MLICDLCRKPLVKKNWVELGKQPDTKQVCTDCIKTCKEIMNNPRVADMKVVHLNEYKELKEQGLV
jgi:hypothetical protein